MKMTSAQKKYLLWMAQDKDGTYQRRGPRSYGDKAKIQCLDKLVDLGFATKVPERLNMYKITDLGRAKLSTVT